MADSDIYVPDEIVNNILARLPTKSLTRFRCVSRYWNHLISDPDFMKSLSRRKIFLSGQFCQTIEKVVSGENIMGYRMVIAHRPTVGGTTNGLVLLVLRSVDMYIYNPLTRVLKGVPNPPAYSYMMNLAFGLGHGETVDDLKIVTLGVYNHAMSLSCGVFSVKNQSWSTMSESPIGFYGFSSRAAGTFLNGFLYWKVSKDHSSFSRSLLLALDIKMMKLLEIDFPCDRRVSYTTMGTVNGCLCLLYYKGFSYGGYELSVMKDYGIWESHLECSMSTLSRMHYNKFFVICILDEGKVIMKNLGDNTFLIVDLLKKSSEPILDCTNYNQVLTTQAIEYVESFCSI